MQVSIKNTVTTKVIKYIYVNDIRIFKAVINFK